MFVSLVGKSDDEYNLTNFLVVWFDNNSLFCYLLFVHGRVTWLAPNQQQFSGQTSFPFQNLAEVVTKDSSKM